MKRVRPGRTLSGQQANSEGADAAAQIAQDVLPRARLDLHAGGVAAEGMADGEVQPALDEGLGLLRGVEPPPGRLDEGRHELPLDGLRRR